MDTLIVVLMAAVGSGVLAGVHSPLIAFTSARIGFLEGVLLPHLIGSVAALVLVLASGSKGMREVGSLPWYGYLPGLMGVAIVLGLSFSTQRLGATATVVAFVVSQLIIGAIVGHFGWLGLPLRPLDAAKLVGIGLLLVGAWLVVKPS
jgi:transporter family-2 protein